MNKTCVNLIKSYKSGYDLYEVYLFHYGWRGPLTLSHSWCVGLGPQDLSERGAYLAMAEGGPLKLKAICQSINAIRCLTVILWPQRPPPPKTERYSLALPCINTKDT